MTILTVLDIETRSGQDLSVCGRKKYFADPEFEVLLVYGYKIELETQTRYVAYEWDVYHHSKNQLKEILEHIGNTPIVAHNGRFDIGGLETYLGCRITNELIDTQALAGFIGLPLRLKYLAQALRLELQKDAAGTRLINKFSKKNSKGVFNTAQDFLDDWLRFKEYCKRDVDVLEQIVYALPKDLIVGKGFFSQTDIEKEFYRKSMVMPSLPFDMETVHNFINVRDTINANIIARQEEFTGVAGILSSPIKFKQYFKDNGVVLQDTTKGYLENIKDTLEPELRNLVEDKLAVGKTSLKKLDAIVAAEVNGGVWDTVQYCGAIQTGRDAGRIFQPQNIPRMSGVDYNNVIARASLGDTSEEMTELMSKSLRAVVKAREGKEFVGADYSSIESRVLAWLAKEEWKIDFYNTPSDFDMYQQVYASAFGVPIESVTKDQRQVGKVMELALGYGGGADAFTLFAKVYNIDWNFLVDTAFKNAGDELFEKTLAFANMQGRLDDKHFIAADYIKRKWRNANKKIGSMWQDLENAVRKAINTSAPFVEKVGRFVVSNNFRAKGLPLYVAITLPSGRNLFYYRPQIDSDNSISYWGQNDNGSYGRQKLYGGKITANVTQATARDILANAVATIEYPCVIRVHDEIVVEVDKGTLTVEQLENMMCQLPEWAEGLPLKASGWIDERYVK